MITYGLQKLISWVAVITSAYLRPIATPQEGSTDVRKEGGRFHTARQDLESPTVGAARVRHRWTWRIWNLHLALSRKSADHTCAKPSWFTCETSKTFRIILWPIPHHFFSETNPYIIRQYTFSTWISSEGPVFFQQSCYWFK